MSETLVLFSSSSPRPQRAPSSFALRAVNGSSARALALACFVATPAPRVCVLALPSAATATARRRPLRFAPLAALHLTRGLEAAAALDPHWSGLYLERAPPTRLEDVLRHIGTALAPILLAHGRAEDARPVRPLPHNRSAGRYDALVLRPNVVGMGGMYVAPGVLE